MPIVSLENDREWLAQKQAKEQREAQEQDNIHHYEQMGMGLAVCCLSFWHTLVESSKVQPDPFSRDEMLRLVEAMIRGR